MSTFFPLHQQLPQSESFNASTKSISVKSSWICKNNYWSERNLVESVRCTGICILVSSANLASNSAYIWWCDSVRSTPLLPQRNILADTSSDVWRGDLCDEMKGPSNYTYFVNQYQTREYLECFILLYKCYCIQVNACIRNSCEKNFRGKRIIPNGRQVA